MTATMTTTAQAAPSVFVVDDEEEMRMLARVFLERGGFNVVDEAADGPEALERFDVLDPPPVPSVVLLDNRMPGLTGQGAGARHRHRRLRLEDGGLPPPRDHPEPAAAAGLIPYGAPGASELVPGEVCRLATYADPAECSIAVPQGLLASCQPAWAVASVREPISGTWPGPKWITGLHLHARSTDGETEFRLCRDI